MPIESSVAVPSDLNASYPEDTDSAAVGSSHLRNIKTAVKSLNTASATAGAAEVGFFQSGTGASTSRKVQDRLRESISVKDFGVVGDGSTDDLTNLNSAIAASAGKDLIFPPGTNCAVTNEVNFNQAGMRVIAHGATITEKAAFGGSNIVRVAAANVAIEGLKVVGLGAGTEGIVATVAGAAGISVRRCEVSGCGYGITANSMSNVTIEENYVHDCSQYPIWVQNVAGTAALSNVNIRNNRLDTSHLDPATAAQVGMLVRGTSTYYTTGVNVTGNYIVMPTSPTASTPIGCEFRYVTGGQFTNNYCKDGSMLVSIAGCTDVTVDGNTSDGAAFYGIEVASIDTVTTDVVVSNNVINGRGRMKYGVGLQGAMDTTRCVVTGNTIKNTTQYGVFVSLRWDDFVISSNSIYMGTAGSLYGIFVQATSGANINGVISGNVMNGAGAAKKAMYLDDSSYLAISGNVIQNWTETGIYLQSDTGTVDYITMTGNMFVNCPNVITTAGAGSFGTRIQSFANPEHRPSGATGGNAVDLTNAVYQCWGTGSPEGVVTAGVGSVFMRRNGGASTTLYVKESGTSNTGWVAK